MSKYEWKKYFDIFFFLIGQYTNVSPFMSVLMKQPETTFIKMITRFVINISLFML